MLTINNIDKIIGKYVTIKGYTFIVDTVIEMPIDYTICIKGMGTLHAPMTILLNRNVNANSYRLSKIGGAIWNDIGLDDLENQRTFLHRLEKYLNNL